MSQTTPLRQRHARWYVTAITLVGTALFAWCVWVVARDGVPLQWLVFAGLTFACGRFTLRVPSVEATFSVSEMVGLTSVLLFGPEAGAITLALDCLALSLHHRGMPLQKALFNFGSLTLAVWVSGSLFFWFAGTGALFGQSTPSGNLVLPLGVMAASYFLLNSGLIAQAIALHAGQRPFTVWRTHFLWLGPGYAAGASIALLLVVAHKQVDFSALALLPPVLAVSFLMLRSSFGRVEDARQHVERLNTLYLSTIETLATAIDAKDDVTHNHIRRVQGAAVALAKEIGVRDPLQLQAIEAAALLHDTGKIAVPEHILNKPGRLTPAEFEKMKLHAPIGAEILSSIDFPYPVVPIVRHHHENWDGTGYPDGLRGTDIPIGARILSVVDCFDALTSDRPYRGRMSDDDALRIVVERRGTMYDPLVVDTFARTHARIMPAGDGDAHPAARAVGEARAITHAESPVPAPASTPDVPLEEMVALTSLSRAVGGGANHDDLAALMWMMVRQVVPCQALAIFEHDETGDAMVARAASGAWGPVLRELRYPLPRGPIGWTAVNRRPIVNTGAMLDAPLNAAPGALPHWVCTVPLEAGGSVVGVLALYAREDAPFTEAHARMLDLLAPRIAASVTAVRDRTPASVPGAVLRPTGTGFSGSRRLTLV